MGLYIPQPLRNGLADFFGGVLLQEMVAEDGYFLLGRQGAEEFALCADEYGAGFGIDEELRHIGFSNPAEKF